MDSSTVNKPVKDHPPQDVPVEVAASLEQCLEDLAKGDYVISLRMRFLSIISPYMTEDFNTGIIWKKYEVALLDLYHIKIPKLNDIEWNYTKKEAEAKYSLRV